MDEVELKVQSRYTFKNCAVSVQQCRIHLWCFALSSASPTRLLRSLVSFADKSAYWEYFGVSAFNSF